jgi:methyltransferase (TIGR00027 family)
MGRAVAERLYASSDYSDETAFELLPEPERLRVERASAGTLRQGPRSLADRLYLRQLGAVMAARTVSIDRAIREKAAGQLVILGAGLDGRAFRMPELRNSVVFEVDHPDSQRDKRARATKLPPIAREVRYVPVDFEQDGLDEALERAGHAPSEPTTWVWEGVVMYLEPEDTEATLAVLQRRSPPGSRLIVVYHAPSVVLRVVGLLTRRMGEPLRSESSPSAMRALLGAHGFAVQRDEDVRSVGQRHPPELSRLTRFVRHMRTVVADRA